MSVENVKSNNLVLKIEFSVFSVCIFCQSIIVIPLRSLLNLVTVSLNYVIIAAWLLRTPSLLTSQSLLILKIFPQLMKLSNMLGFFDSLKLL